MPSVPEAIYDTWDCSRSRASVSGMTMMPLAGPPPQPSVPICLDGGMDIEVIVFVASRYGAPPVIPSPTSQNPNRIFLGGGQSAAFPIVDMAGYCWYSITGAYVFGILNPEGLESTIYLGSAPMPGQPAAVSELILPTNIQYGLVNDSSTQLIPPYSTASYPSLQGTQQNTPLAQQVTLYP